MDDSNGTPPCSRRRFLALLPGLAALAAVAGVRPLRAALGPHDPLGPLGGSEHPDPRPGIDGSKVLTADDLAGFPNLIELYDGVRKHAALADGVQCQCGCAQLSGHRSLLICYEESAMAKFCPICQAQGRLLVGRAEEGQTLEQIRRAIDARFGSVGGESARAGRSLRAQRANGVDTRGATGR